MMFYTRVCYVGIRNCLVHICLSIRVLCPTHDRMNFYHFSTHFLKHLKWFCFTLLLYTATMVQILRMPHFHSGMRIADLPQIRTSIQQEKIKKWMSELNYHKESTQDDDRHVQYLLALCAIGFELRQYVVLWSLARVWWFWLAAPGVVDS